MVAQIFLALKSISALAELFQTLISEVKNLTLVLEEKQIETFKKEVNETLNKIQNATSDSDRKRWLLELSGKLSK